VDVDGSSCSVSVAGAAGDVKISNSYKPVALKNTSGSIEVRGDSSPIEVSSIDKLPAAGRVELYTTYKPVTLFLPASTSAKIFARTEYGKIRSDFPVYLNNTDEKTATIDMGSGGAVVRIETTADIILRRQ
jgi:DUF4097 and DUF4098 domain-containing protein YvlB